MQNSAVMPAFDTQFHVITWNMFEAHSTLQRLLSNQLFEAIYSLHI
jgi:hypothetical protein